MEDLLASIRKAIHDDIGDMPRAGTARQPLAPPAPARQPRPGDELAAAAIEIQQLREKISRARGGKPLPPVEPAQRAASLSAALHSDTPRRNWRELEPAPLPPRLRGSVAEPEAPRAAPAPQPAPQPRAEAAPPQPAPRALPSQAEADAMLSGNSAQAVQTAFNRLADSVLARATSERSLEEVTRDMLRVMLKQWLDDNLPGMVERMVREEIERVARTGR